MMTRRELLSRAATVALTAALPRPASRAAAMAATESPRDKLARLLDRAADSLLDGYPESATFLGLDTGEHAGLKSRLTDRSIAGDARLADNCRARLRELRAF